MKHLQPITQFNRIGLVSAVAVLIATSASVLGGTISISPSYVQSFDEGMNALGTLPGAGATTPVGGYLQYEFRMTLDNLAADEDFWTAIFNVQLGPGLAAGSEWLDPGTAQLNGYYPASPSLSSYDSNGATPGGSQFHWQFGNDDFGVDPNDLQTIIVEVSPEEAANRQYGELIRPAAGSPDGLGWPTLVGTVLVQRTALVASSITVSPIAGSAWGTYAGNALGDGLPTAQVNPATFNGGTAILLVPEPCSLGLALMAGMVGVLFGRHRRRRADGRR
jgi:hypothetical protein